MYIVAKQINTETGELKGKGYTYISDIELEVDDIIRAPFGQTERTLMVTDVNVPQPSFECKHVIEKLDSTEDVPEVEESGSIKLEVKKEVMPVIQINFEELKENLTASLKKYKNMVVTAETLPACKAQKKELASLRTKVDNYRKTKKKELSEPITAFEAQCKELIALISDAEKPLEEGIQVFDDKKRDAKRNFAQGAILEVVKELGLTEKYAIQLTVLDKYCNLTAKEIDVRNDIEQRGLVLQGEQKKEEACSRR